MHGDCICRHGEPCFHDAFVFSVGETADRSVELCLYQADGQLSVLSISDFTSWKRIRGGRKVRGFNKTVLIDRITRETHCLTIDCFDIAFLFFGQDVQLRVADVARVASPRLFGDGPGIEYRRKYMKYFNEPTGRVT